jgi:integrase
MNFLVNDGVDWNTIEGTDLLRRLASKPRAHLSHLRCGLVCAFTDTKARHKWPDVFRIAETTFAPKFAMDDLTTEIQSVEGLETSLVDMKVVQCAMKNVEHANEIKTENLYMRAWCIALTDLAPVPLRVRAMLLFRWPGDKEIISIFRLMAQTSSDHGGRNGLIVLLSMFYKLCVLLQPFGDISNRIKSVSRDELVDIVATRGTQSLKYRISNLLSLFRRGSRWEGFIVPWQNWQAITTKEVGYDRKRRQRDRHTFSWNEIQALFETANDNTRDYALLRYFIHTSRRRASACELLVEDVWNASSRSTKTEGFVLEKNNQRVSFPIDEVLGMALTKWICESGVTDYVFPSPIDSRHKWQGNGIRVWLGKLCQRAKITGNHVHVHALRHTVATLLHDSGNKIEDISAFLGHRGTQATHGYIHCPVSRQPGRMAIPWLTKPEDMAGPYLTPRSTTVLSELIGDFHNVNGTNGSSSSTENFGDVMLGATTQQQQLVVALKQQLICREEEMWRQKDVYNFIVGNVLSDAQRLVLGEWMKKTTPLNGQICIPLTWQETLVKTYNDGVSCDDSTDGESE